jgi:hypothetical protein
LGQKRTLDRRPLISALLPKADIRRHEYDVRFVPKDGVIGRWLELKDFWVLRFRLMVKRGPWMRPQASEVESLALAIVRVWMKSNWVDTNLR